MLSNEKKRRRFEERTQAMRERRNAQGRKAAERRRREEAGFARMAAYLAESERRLQLERRVSALAGIPSSHVRVERNLKYQLGAGHSRLKTNESNRGRFQGRRLEQAG